MNGEVITLDKQQLGAFIAENRKRQGLTQQQLAQTLHVTDKAVSKWERGLSYPDVTLLQPLAAAFGLRVDDLLTCRAAEKEEHLKPDITPVPEPVIPEPPMPETASPAVQAVLDISQENLDQRRKKLIRRILAGVLAFAALALVGIFAFLVLNQRSGETYNIFKRQHSPVDHTISIEAYPASLFNDDQVLVRAWKGRYYLADDASQKARVSVASEKGDTFRCFYWSTDGVYAVAVTDSAEPSRSSEFSLWNFTDFKETRLTAVRTAMGASIRQRLTQEDMAPPDCDTVNGTLRVNGFFNDTHILLLIYTAPDGTVYKLAYDCDADTLALRDT